MKKIVIATVLLITSNISSACLLTGAAQLPANTTFAVSQTVLNLINDPNFPQLDDIIVNARDAWKLTT